MTLDIFSYKTIFWDFDGVIKESNQAKTQAYLELFSDFGADVREKVKNHHRENGGISRFVKIPMYFRDFAGITLTQTQLEEQLRRYSELTLDAVVAAEWVPGAREYIERNYSFQNFYIVTGTPQEDIEEICRRMNFTSYFRGIFGAPRDKTSIVGSVLEKETYEPSQCLFIGDALADFEAARNNGIDFLLRQNAENRELFRAHDVTRVENFLSPVNDMNNTLTYCKP